MPCNNALLFLPCFTGEPRRGRLRVGTDPGLALLTRKGTGYYKIPSLKGVWYRGHYLHDGSVASLEEMFDADRLRDSHVPGGYSPPGVQSRAIKGHECIPAHSVDSSLAAFTRRWQSP
jgi:cytochrome c peroxidase